MKSQLEQAATNPSGSPLYDDTQQMTNSEVAQPVQSEARLSVFISYKRGDQADLMVSRIHNELSKDYDVFFDRTIRPGEEWEAALKAELNRADFFIALISEDANDSGWVKAEIEAALKLREQTGSPIIIPVVVGGAELGLLLNAYLIPFQKVYWPDPEDFATFIEDLKRILSNQPVEIPDALIIGLDHFLMNEFTISCFADSYVETAQLRGALEQWINDTPIWITGDAGVRNYAALSLAVKKGAERIYDIPRSQSWKRITNARPRNSICVFRDTLPDHFEEEMAKGELENLRRLLADDNWLIFTSSDDEFLEARRQMRRESQPCHHVSIHHGTYNTAAKRDIFRALLETASWYERLDLDQRQFGLDLLEEPEAGDGERSQRRGRWGARGDLKAEARSRFQQVIGKWLPDDIHRFVVDYLPEAKTLADVAELLRHNATLDDEIHSWFLSLDDSTKCFVLTLAIFEGLDNQTLWDKYKQIIHRLRHLDARLSLWPLGICRQRAARYVSAEGPVEFIDERIAEAVRLEMATNYREYLVELMAELKQWSLAQADRRDRLAVARMVGEALKIEIGDLLDLIKEWAADLDRQIRDAFASAVERTVTDVSGAKRVFDLLQEWCFNPSASDQKLTRVWAAAAALGRIAAVAPGSPTSKQAIRYLLILTNDQRSRVSGFVAVAVKRAARKLPLANIETVLYRLARVKSPFARLNAADALNEARAVEEAAANRLLAEWASSEDASLRWLATGSLLLWKKSGEDRIAAIARLMSQDPALFAQALRETINNEDYRSQGLTTLYQLAQQSDYGSNSELVMILAESLSRQADEELLVLLKASGRPRLAELVYEIRSQMWTRLLAVPDIFLATIHAELCRPEPLPETYKALELILRPEPAGYREQFVQALAACFQHEHERLEVILAKLKLALPATASDAALMVRGLGLSQLLSHPDNFVAFACSDLHQPERADDTLEILDLFARTRVPGYQTKLIDALIKGHYQRPDDVRFLLFRFREANRAALSDVVRLVEPRLLDSLLDADDPLLFLAEIQRTRSDPQEWQNSLNYLEKRATPGPDGRRANLIDALAQAMAQQPRGVEDLLWDHRLRARPHLGLWFRLRVKFAFHVGKLWG